MRAKELFYLISALLGLGTAFPARAVEAWADTRLVATNGLELWLDASRQISARQQRALRPLADGMAIDHWLDASGHRRDVSQIVRESMPQFRMGGGVAWISFDGKDDFLVATAQQMRFTNCTVFIVAAPRSNPGGFRGLFGCAEKSQNDYVRGLNIDLGVSGSSIFNNLNIEAAGAVGARSLMRTGVGFGEFHVLAIEVGPKALSVDKATQNPNASTSSINLWLDNQAQESRERASVSLAADELVIGARIYSNTADLPYVQGFLDGSVAEVLLYDRALDEPARNQIAAYLSEKYKSLRQGGGAGGFNPLIPVHSPPAVQMFVPGFAVRELPVHLKNINCVKYRPDGKLVTLGYDGNIFLLSDTDGDGVEDKVEPFWQTNSLRAPIGMALTPPGYALGQGVFVAAKGKLALLVDTNGDDRADREIVVAEGWHELSHGVDALGAAIDSAGNVYFGLGAANFTNPYLVENGGGAARYNLQSERGTILKVSPDFKHREILCTGIRFPVAMAFNSRGDLFSTDQEGATWLANGNPFDELLHIEPGRHYGFPPRHPKYLPNVIDEPSTLDYAPQHQSTCGLNFNSIKAGEIFGPNFWAGDAFVSGYSRGKLYRTKLVKTAAGYVAESQLLASLNMLT
ncbi:MAG TPA: hypothetical protein VGE41_00260, partial [Verrucomicrobiae bacterium]